MKKAFELLCAALFGASLVLLYLHRGMILAAIRGEEMPEAPDSCPAFKKEAKAAEVAEEPASEPDEEEE